MINRLTTLKPKQYARHPLADAMDRIEELKITMFRNSRGGMVVGYEIHGSMGDFTPEDYGPGDGSPTEKQLMQLRRLIDHAVQPIDPDGDADQENMVEAK